jgi:hypothetical protein
MGDGDSQKDKSEEQIHKGHIGSQEDNIRMVSISRRPVEDNSKSQPV